MIILGVIGISIVTSLLNTGAALSAQDGIALSTPTVDRLAEPTLPADPGQADIGAVDYWLVCMVCHGDRGQGLTEEWRAVSGPEEMNCWQSRCHASNHPPEGFVFPRYAPRIIGQGSLARFTTAADLYTFISEKMPWQAPGVLDDERYWRLTAFLIQANNLNLGSEPLNQQNAHLVILRDSDPKEFSNEESVNLQDAGPVSNSDTIVERDWVSTLDWYWWFGIAILLLGLFFIGLKFARD